MAARYNAKDISKLRGREIFVDANVLIYLFWATGSQDWEKQYASLFKGFLKQGNKLYIDFSVISEIINREIRIAQGVHTEYKNEYKKFRDSPCGQSTLKDIYTIVGETILPTFNIIGKNFDKDDIKCLLIVDKMDFVDKSILSICKDNNFVLLTNDKDFKDANIDIVTCNPKL